MDIVHDAGFVQRREWMLYKITPDHYPMNVSAESEIGSPEPQLIRDAVGRMMEKHEILRTTLAVKDGVLKQVIHSPEEFPVNFTFYDLSDFPDDKKMEMARMKTDSLKSVPFNFEFGPLFRVMAFRITAARSLICFVFHHMIADEHSLQLFMEEIREIASNLNGEDVFSLSDPFFRQYSSYSFLENELLDTDKGDKHRKYWEEQLVNGLPGLEVIGEEKRVEQERRYLKKYTEVMRRVNQLPFFDKRCLPSVIRRYEMDVAGAVKYVYDRCLFERIGVYKENSRNGLFALFIGSLLLSLHKLSGQKIFAFEMPGSSRVDTGFRKTIGWLTTGGPCFFDISAGSSPGALLDHIDEQVYQLSRHCVYPCDAVGYRSTPPAGSHMPVFLNLSYIHSDGNPVQSGITLHETSCRGTFQDIAFFFTLFNDSVTLQINYDNLLFNPAQVERIITEQVAALDTILSSFD